jgi:hypothetical protein
MKEERNTFVIKLDEDVAEFLDVKNKSASDLNAYINQLLHAEKARQTKPSYSQRQKEAQPGNPDWVI